MVLTDWANAFPVRRDAILLDRHVLHVAIIKAGNLPLFDHYTIAGKDR
jgi:hypothetical protein